MSQPTRMPKCIECDDSNVVVSSESNEDSTAFHCNNCNLDFTRRDAFIKFLEVVKELGPFFEEVDYSEVNRKLEQDFPGLKIERTFGMLPTQSEGFYNDKGFYFRFRWNTARLQVGEFLGYDKLPGNPIIVEKEDVTDEPYAGVLTAEEFYELFSYLFKKFIEKEQG